MVAIEKINPFRYRGYYYDTETGFYYLQTRYYDPTICRFINADNYELVGALSSVVGELNLYVYCGNNPIMYIDLTGNSRFIDAISRFFSNLISDIRNFDRNNTSESVVLNSHYFSAYKGKLVFRLPIGKNAFSFGVIVLGTGISKTDYDTVKHEYGHTLQFEKLGLWNFTFQVAIPSLTGNILDRMEKLPVYYYSQPWEYEADKLGGVDRGVPLVPMSFWDLITSI